ncbi:hypothetical protein K1719_002767 [Acacia pycnantha]|nr:hypothetical protein K1719_002767 [Acacia pycnantha]
MPSEEYGKRNEWQEWADQLISEDDPLTSNWDDLLTDNVQDLEPKVKWDAKFHIFQGTSPKVSSYFLLHLETIALVLPQLPQIAVSVPMQDQYASSRLENPWYAHAIAEAIMRTANFLVPLKVSHSYFAKGSYDMT